MEKSNIAGLILAGGSSQRMGKDKAFLKYHGIPQYQYTAELVKQLQLPVYISCQISQLEFIDSKYQTITDILEPCGPLGGIISAMRTHPEHDKWLILGCDYPLLQLSDLEKLLVESKDKSNLAYFHQFFIPTLGIYDCSSLPTMEYFYSQRNFKMQHVLQELKTGKIKPNNLSRIKSYDTPADYKKLKP